MQATILRSYIPSSSCGVIVDIGSCTFRRSGKTLVVHGVDLSAPDRGEYGTVVMKSVDDGESWTDETGDLVTISPGPGTWYENDFYFITRGEGITVKRNFES